jgi:hypothetical protein
VDSWEAFAGMILFDVGKRRSGKTHTVAVMQVLVCMTEADAKRVAKKHPSLKFLKKKRRRPKEVS